MTNNYNIIKPLLSFESEDDFYFLQILKRRKDNPGMKGDVTVVKEYFIDSIEYLESKLDEIITYTTINNGRAMINLNKRSYKKAALRMLVETALKIETGQYKNVRKTYSHVVGKYASDSQKKWIIDIDDEDFDVLDKMDIDLEELMNSANPQGINKIIARIPSKTGTHLIVKPFDTREFVKIFPFLEIKKSNPTNLYVP